MLKRLLFFIPIALSFGSTQDLINAYCGGQTPCYLCTNSTDIARCENNLCPLGKVPCEPTCPEGGHYNAQTGKCEANPS